MTPVAELVIQPALDTEREYELVNGQPEVKEMAGARHGGVTARLIVRLGGFVEANQLGSVYTPDTTFKIGQNERLPDVAFVAAERFPAEGEPTGIWQLVPDLAVEVISPHDIWDKVNQKRHEYFAAGVREVWLISLEAKEAERWTSLSAMQLIREDDDLTSENLLPGFRCRLGDLFQVPVRRSL